MLGLLVKVRVEPGTLRNSYGKAYNPARDPASAGRLVDCLEPGLEGVIIGAALVSTAVSRFLMPARVTTKGGRAPLSTVSVPVAFIASPGAPLCCFALATIILFSSVGRYRTEDNTHKKGYAYQPGGPSVCQRPAEFLCRPLERFRARSNLVPKT